MDKKMKTNQDGGGKSSTAPANELKANQEGAAKYKGAHDYDTSKGSHDHPHGAAKMGYSQSFGAARMNGYAKGAARVANIMSFGASKYMNHGAADTGHGGPEGHTHPSMTLKSRTTSGGGGSSSSSNTTGGGSNSSTQSTDNLKNYQAGLVDLGADFKPTAEQTSAANAKVAELKKKDALASAANESRQVLEAITNTTNAGSSTTTSNTTTSPNSMAETLLKGNIADENRSQRFNFNRDETNIKAANDSITKRNSYLDNLRNKSFAMSDKAQSNASRLGGQEAAKTRINSGFFSGAEVNAMYQDGQKKK